MALPTVGTGTGSIIGTNPNGTPTNPTGANYDTTAAGFDLIYMQSLLQQQMLSVQGNIQAIEQNANLSDTEKMFSMQMAMNTWSAIANLRTNMLKTVSDSLKSVARNVS
ncbi:EscF/YscF/HrpA family type III secretion system needle major subunit [Methyloraptor flagellatus]|jgi:type III secretion apparatus needle protein|uniref:EscF/YscF/HrpA family type III secretion system needle major subunit n=1 Tax=Methyloraptor flagellatus TaxID=3162530 RepID=A0AAU7X520_9HYPH